MKLKKNCINGFLSEAKKVVKIFFIFLKKFWIFYSIDHEKITNLPKTIYLNLLYLVVLVILELHLYQLALKFKVKCQSQHHFRLYYSNFSKLKIELVYHNFQPSFKKLQHS